MDGHHPAFSARNNTDSPQDTDLKGNEAKGLEQLVNGGHLNARQRDALAPVAAQFGVAITPQMLDLIDPENPLDPIAAQFVPDLRELETAPEELRDPIGDHAHSPVTGIIHRYPDRVLLTPLLVCPVYCRFCFRREDVGQQPLLTDEQLDKAIQYIRDNKNIWEVILSGGDPLILSPRRLEKILKALHNIDHVKVLRIHTRVPVVSPTKISAELIRVLKAANPLYVVIHSNHAQEFSSEAKSACARLADAGLPLLSQSVLLKGINDDAGTLTELMRLLVELRIKPYYLHHADQARGTGHFRTSLKAGQELISTLRGNVSGLCQPQYILDIPGGYGKTPVSPDWVTSQADGSYEICDFRGERHHFEDKA